MTKDVFLSLLEHKLTDGGMPKDIVNKSVSHLNEHFSKMSENECITYIEKLGGDDAVAERLLADYKKSESVKKAATEKKSDAAQTPASAEKTEKNRQTPKPEEKPKKDMSDLLDDDDAEKPRKKPATSDTTKNPAVRKRPTPNVKDGRPTSAGKNGKRPDNARPSNKKGNARRKSKDKDKLSVGFIVCIPFLAVLALLAAMLIISLYAIVALAVVAFSAMLVVLTAAGTALAVIAVIYGITQMSQAGGAGLYEMGIGVIAGGVTMLFGILMYNFIVRLAPFIYKKLMVLIKFSVEKFKQLFNNVKEASLNI